MASFAAHRPALAVALLCGALAWTWQFLTVTRNYSGNWTALFMTGRSSPVPPALDAGTYRFSSGYDGPCYRYMAHDPLFRKGYAPYCEDPRLRYRRILAPALASLLSAGHDAWVDDAYMAVILLFVCAGAYWTASIACLYGRHPLWGAVFLLVPGTLTSIDRMLVDGACSAFMAAFVLYTLREKRWAVWCVLAAAALTRETGLLFAAGTCLCFLARKQFKPFMFYATATLPWLLWSAFVWAHTPTSDAGNNFARPIYGVIGRLFTPSAYPFSPMVNHALQTFDLVAISGHLLAFVLALWWFLRSTERGPAEFAALLFAALGLMLGSKYVMTDAYGYSRPLSPLYLFLFLRFLTTRLPVMAAPMLMVSAQVGLYFFHQFLGILGVAPVGRLSQ